MMRRFFGKAKPKVPGPTLDDASNNLQKRGDSVDVRIKKLDEELLRYKAQLSKMKPGPAKNQLQQRALRVLKQKKVYEKQRDSLLQQQFNVDQTKFAQENVKESKTTIQAMKDASKELKKGIKELNIDEVEDVHDDMADLLEQADEIQDVMGREYNVPEELDEQDLMNELDSLEQEIAQEDDTESVPAYLVSAASAANNKDSVKVPESDEVNVDEFGLPKVPAQKLHA